jgi:hypothetical protein
MSYPLDDSGLSSAPRLSASLFGPCSLELCILFSGRLAAGKTLAQRLAADVLLQLI